MNAADKDRPKAMRTLNEWRDWLCEEEIPVFSNTVLRINAAIEDDNTGAAKLASIIMEDTSLTAKILKLGNSVHYNPSRQSVATLTRATVILGTKTIHEMALACSFIETMQSARNKRRASQEIARSLHAAIQARSMAMQMRDPSPEEVFVASLLFNIGHIAFSCFEQVVGEKIETLIKDEKLPAEKAEIHILGFTLRQLGAAMSKAWHLKGLIEEVFSGKSLNPQRVKLVMLCNKLALTAEQDGWTGANTYNVARDLAHMMGKPIRDVLEAAKRNAQAAAEIAAHLGAKDAAKLVPVQNPSELPPDETRQAPDPNSLLIRIHQDITNLLSSEFNVNVLFELILESIHRGLGMDRTLFAMVSPDRKMLKEKSSHGWAAAGTHFPINIELDTPPTHLFNRALNQSDALWVKPETETDTRRLYTPAIQSAFGVQECFIFPFALNRKPIGLLYADRATSGNRLDQEAFNHFRQLGQQAMIGLRLTSVKN